MLVLSPTGKMQVGDNTNLTQHLLYMIMIMGDESPIINIFNIVFS